jgi:hypothetical protein
MLNVSPPVIFPSKAKDFHGIYIMILRKLWVKFRACPMDASPRHLPDGVFVSVFTHEPVHHQRGFSCAKMTRIKVRPLVTIQPDPLEKNLILE